jgi:hypothetical protein
MTVKKVIALAVLAIAAWQVWRLQSGTESAAVEAGISDSLVVTATAAPDSGDEAAEAYRSHARGRVLTVQGRVQRVLADDREGSRHQRFVLRTASGQTVLVAHNIDLAPRLEGLAAGEMLVIRGEYQWNEQGGLLHWTHRDPGGNHPPGYIERNGRRYQ